MKEVLGGPFHNPPSCTQNEMETIFLHFQRRYLNIQSKILKWLAKECCFITHRASLRLNTEYVLHLIMEEDEEPKKLTEKPQVNEDFQTSLKLWELNLRHHPG